MNSTSSAARRSFGFACLSAQSTIVILPMNVYLVRQFDSGIAQ